MRLTSLFDTPGLDAQGHDGVIDLARADPVDVGLHDDRPEGPVDAAAWLQQRREEGAVGHLGDVQLDVAGLGREQPAAAAVAAGRALLAALVSPCTDHLLGFELDEPLKDEGHGFAERVLTTTGADGLEQLRQADCDRAIGISSCSLAGTR